MSEIPQDIVTLWPGKWAPARDVLARGRLAQDRFEVPLCGSSCRSATHILRTPGMGLPARYGESWFESSMVKPGSRPGGVHLQQSFPLTLRHVVTHTRRHETAWPLPLSLSLCLSLSLETTYGNGSIEGKAVLRSVGE